MALSDQFDDPKLLRIDRILDRTGLVPFRREHVESERAADRCAIVFVHGFDTNSLGTWGYGPEWVEKSPRSTNGRSALDFWPYTFCKAVGADGYCFQYLNSKADKNQQTPLPHDAVAKEFLDGLLDISDAYDRIILVTHSFGGLIAKAAIVQAQSFPDHELAARKLFGLYAMSCPNYGHFFAAIAANIPLFATSANVRLLSNVRVFRPNNDLARLDTQFATEAAKLPNLHVRTMTETKRVYRVFRVSEDDAKLQNAEGNDRSTYDHFWMCKGLVESDAEWDFLKRFVCRRFTVQAYQARPLAPR